MMARRSPTSSPPERMCVGCRQRAPVPELVRVVAVDGGPGPDQLAHVRRWRLVPDPRRRLPGRGANLHPTEECLTSAVRRRAFVRALRLDAAADDVEVRAYVVSSLGSVGTTGADVQHDRTRIRRRP